MASGNADSADLSAAFDTVEHEILPDGLRSLVGAMDSVLRWINPFRRDRTSSVTIDLLNVLSKLGLEEYYPNKLTLQFLLEVKKTEVHENEVLTLNQIPFQFLTNLFKLNAECRNFMTLMNNTEEDLYDEDNDDNEDDNVHPLDLIVALFLCADSCLQQEMVLKMSMCQFSLPLLMPPSKNSPCTLMLWALREIVKEWQPHDLSRGFKENYMVQENIPLISFVRLKNCSLSKSQVLNHILSHDQQSHNMFIHREMLGGELQRKISGGLVEVCWFLPSGREKLDVFPNPVAFANLRGDISESQTQFTFLMEVSTAVFVFLDRVEDAENQTFKSVKNQKLKMFLVVNCAKRRENMDTVRKMEKELELPKDHVLIKDSGVNAARFSMKLYETIKTLVSDSDKTISVENMCDTAADLGLSVDEEQTLEQKKTAQKIFGDIRSIPQFKNQQLPLQGQEWKSLARLEREECRIKVKHDLNIEHRKSEIREEKQKIREAQAGKHLSSGVIMFIETLLSSDKRQRDCFLRWMQFLFNTHSRKMLTELREEFKEQCKKKNAARVAEIDQKLVNSSLGLEHYMREVGLVFEFSLPVQNLENLPGVAADMLLDGYPLELLDGEASIIPEKWITRVLMELHQKVGGRSRLLVLTVLGVQSTGKSTLLNTMFGVQFPVSSGRCTRGAYMLFLKVGEDMQCDFDFILLIDTEGLKSADLAQLDDSYEHDNQLATFVIGLSDITIINLAMENATEMKDILQIAVHAFLRMKEIGKKPICHFVHQNVGSVSVHGKTLTERKRLLDHLNEMTLVAAEMEKKSSIKTFTDVLDYNMESNNWYIPGLWHGTPPMAPVNTGYSEAVADFKNKLLETVKQNQDSERSTIPDFIKWIKSLWKAVKYEDFIFSFRNTLVAHAYDNLCKEFSQWEWEFRKEILSKSGKAELEIQNADSESDLEKLADLVKSKKSEVIDSVITQESNMREKLNDYYKRKDRNVKLIEKYKSDFLTSITSLSNEIKHTVYTKLDSALERKKVSMNVQDIQRENRNMMEQKVLNLLKKVQDHTMSDEELRSQFEQMWTSATVNVPPQKERNISESVLFQLKENLSHQNVNELFFHVGDLTQHGRGQFKVRNEHIDSHSKKKKKLCSNETQMFVNKVIDRSEKFILDKSKTNQDYDDSFIRELLEEVDRSLEESFKRHKTNRKFEFDLKLHVCGIAARKFQQVHKKFLSVNDPRLQLDKNKEQYFHDFVDLFRQRDDCQRKAENFVTLCIKPAVEDYIIRSLGINIVDEILRLHSLVYSSRSFFQYNILKELLLQDDFKSIVKYCREYEKFVKDWICQQISQMLQENQTLPKLKSNNLQMIVDKIRGVIEEAVEDLPGDDQNVTKLVDEIRRSLIKDVTISEEDVKRSLFQIKSTSHQFGLSVLESIDKMTESFNTDFLKHEDVTETLNQLPIKPQDELFKRVFGCGHQCPFCKVPCEAGGKDHKMHHATIHRPQAFGRYHDIESKKLAESICTTDMTTGRRFISEETKQEVVPYTQYAEFYPDWYIPPDASIQASDYWKHVLVKYNQQLAQEYKAKPAKIPKLWTEITEDKALEGLKEAFNISAQDS